MFTYFFTLLRRNLYKTRLFTSLNIIGLALGFTGFILAYQYINRETSYDRWNPNYDDIYLVGLTYQGNYTVETPPSLAKTIKENFPEVVHAGSVLDYSYSYYPVFGEETVNVKNTVLIDSAAAAIFQVESQSGPLYKNVDQKDATLVTETLAKQLFPNDYQDFSIPKSVPVLSKSLGVEEAIYGVSKNRKLSYLDYEILFIKKIEDETTGNPYTYQTFIQVKPGTDVAALNKKISALYSNKTAKHESVRSSSFALGSTYLDPLSHQHLRPQHGSNSPYLTIWVLGILSIVILTLSAANFTNLIMAQADKRAKEIGMKKLFGSSRRLLSVQFLAEVFIQCLLAAVLAWLLLLFSGNLLQKWLNDDLSHYLLSLQTLVQLIAAVVLTTLIAGIYPSITLSSFHPLTALKGKLEKKSTHTLLRNSLLGFQFVIAIVFITGALIVNQQMAYIHSSDKGFEPSQVINFKSVGMYYDGQLDGSLYNMKQRLLQSPSISAVSAATNIPGTQNLPPKKHFSYVDKKVEMEHIGIDKGYFETLGISTVAGKPEVALERLVNDSLMHYAVLNETAALQMGIQGDIAGAKIMGCDVEFTVAGIVKDSKAYGFENKVAPTIYSYKNECGPGRYKTSLIVKTAVGGVSQAIQAVEKEWKDNPHAESLPLDYEFLDQQYALIHARQDQLKAVLNGFTLLSIAIAILGLFSMSAYQISRRQKEMSVRKVLGASAAEVFYQLNKPFLRLFLIAIFIAAPITYMLLSSWLDNFAYKISISPGVFSIGILSITSLLLVVISYHAAKALRTNPVDSLRDE